LPVPDTRDTNRRVQVSLLHRQEGTIHRVAIFYTLSYPSIYFTLPSKSIEWQFFTHFLTLVFTSFQTAFIAENLVAVLHRIQDIPGIKCRDETAYPDRDPFAVSPFYGMSVYGQLLPSNS
jgi:hypothetical protein